MERSECVPKLIPLGIGTFDFAPSIGLFWTILCRENYEFVRWNEMKPVQEMEMLFGF